MSHLIHVKACFTLQFILCQTYIQANVVNYQTFVENMWCKNDFKSFDEITQGPRRRGGPGALPPPQ